MTASSTRLNLGCGPFAAAGWLNADLRDGAGVDLRADIRERLPIDDSSLDCVVAMHVLQDLAWNEIPAALRELKRILRSGGVLRLGLPDLDRAIDAYRRGDGAYFHIPDQDAKAVGAKLVTQIVWYGSVRTPFNFDFASESLAAAGYRQIVRCAFHETRHGDAGIVALDNRERETLFVEALA